MRPVRAAQLGLSALAAAELFIAVFNAVLPTHIWRVVFVFSDIATAMLALVALVWFTLYQATRNELSTAVAQNRELRKIAPAHAVCGWCEFTGDPLKVLMHEGSEHSA